MKLRLKHRLFLASGSPRRKEILDVFGIPYSVIPNGLRDEFLRDGISLRTAVRQLALAKAKASRSRYRGLILGADTIVVLGTKILGKPTDRSQAKEFLALLSGKTHHVISAVGLLDTISNRTFTGSEINAVTFRNLSRRQIEDYVTQFEVLDKAGAYGIQDCEEMFISNISGDRFSVMGLPIQTLLKIMKRYVIV